MIFTTRPCKINVIFHKILKLSILFPPRPLKEALTMYHHHPAYNNVATLRKIHFPSEDAKQKFAKEMQKFAAKVEDEPYPPAVGLMEKLIARELGWKKDPEPDHIFCSEMVARG